MCSIAFLKNLRPEPQAKRPKGREKVIEAGDEDRAFFEDHGQFLTFLDNMDASALDTYVTHRLKQEHWLQLSAF